ncbi:MAG: hypothetical protein WA947_08045 [Phormidesmis sp.]
MVMLTGIKAFEFRWQTLQAKYPISAVQKKLIMQSMGRLIDNYATQEEIKENLPAALRILFDRLVDAYLKGCWVEADGRPVEEDVHRPAPTMTPAMLAAAQLRQQKRQQPTEASEADTYVVDENAAAAIRRIQSRVAYV